MILSKPSTGSGPHRREGSSTAFSRTDAPAADRRVSEAPGIISPRQAVDSIVGQSSCARGLTLSVQRPEPAVVVVRIGGEIDLACAPRLTELIQQRMTAAVLRAVVLDLSEVTFCSSAGLELLLHAQRRAEYRGIDMYIVAEVGGVRRLLDLTGLQYRFDLRGSVVEALAALR